SRYSELHDIGIDLPYRGEMSRKEADATLTYARSVGGEYAFQDNKVSEWVREYVHLKPDMFLVYDRASANPAYPKSLSWHVVHEPELNQPEQIVEGTQLGGIYRSPNATIFEAERGQSKLFVNILLPQNGEKDVVKIGGKNAAGEEFVQEEYNF